MKWQHNPDNIEFGFYAYKKKNTDTPIIINVSVENGMPAHTKGWWLGPLILPTETKNGVSTIACVCINCRCWTRKRSSPHGICHCNPPVDNNWSVTQETDHCFKFVPK